MKRSLICLAIAACCGTAHAQPLGRWLEDGNGLPAFSYDGRLPYHATLSDGRVANLGDSPWFLLGNYRATVFVHVNGEYELISGERSWARMNLGSRPDSGENAARLTIGKKTYLLAGPGSLAEDPDICERVFGCGYARWTFHVDGLEIVRTMRINPSTEINTGDAAVLIRLEVTNLRGGSRKASYEESVLANYVQTQFQRGGNRISFRRSLSVGDGLAVADFQAVSEDPFNLPSRQDRSEIDAYAPSLYLCGEGVVASEYGTLLARSELVLKRGKTAVSEVVVGWILDAAKDRIFAAVDRVKSGSDADWKAVLPAFPDEPDHELARELVWHAYTLEAMATYSEYFGETKIPQGTVYDYYWGQHASARDNFQHGLAPVYYNPPLAASILRYMAARTTAWGDIRLIEYGNGNADHSFYNTSDQQLFFFQMISEYLRVNKDFGFLDTKIRFYPKTGEGTMLEVTEQCFNYLRNFIGVGRHGLVKLLNSDWNDNIFVLNNVRYNNVIGSGESHMNSAMVLAVFPELIRSLQAYRGPQESKARRLAEGMSLYYEAQYAAFMKDLGDREFPRRMYFDGKAVGEEDMWLEPLGYLLQSDRFPVERKRALLQEMKKRVYAGEKVGARQQENPQGSAPGLEPGSRENGGMWWALNGPVVSGVATFDRQEAGRLLKQLSLSNYAREFPEYWTSWWSSSDNIESSLMGPQEGLPDQSLDYWEIPVYCAHPHAWILYCYYKLHE